MGYGQDLFHDQVDDVLNHIVRDQQAAVVTKLGPDDGTEGAAGLMFVAGK